MDMAIKIITCACLVISTVIIVWRFYHYMKKRKEDRDIDKLL